MAQILFTIGSYSQRSYGLIVALAIILGAGVAYVLASSEKEYREHLLNMLLYGVIGAVVGARLWQVFFYDWPFYSQHPVEILMLCPDLSPFPLAKMAQGHCFPDVCHPLFHRSFQPGVPAGGRGTLSF